MSTRDSLERATHRLRDQFRPLDLPPATAAVALVALLAWTAMLDGWLPMPTPGPDLGPMSAPGVPEAIGTSNGAAGVAAYLAMWSVMMVAMMYPAMTPFVRRYAAGLPGSPAERVVAVTALLAAYSTVWGLVGVVPLALDALVGLPDLLAANGSLVLGGSLLLAGGYQFTVYKRDTLADCCASVPETTDGPLAAVRRGVDHGLRCLRCTWPLMLTMVVAGTMNLFWMLLVTFAVTVERYGGDRVATTVGVLALVGGVAALTLGISPA